MRNKITVFLAETAVLNLLAIFFTWKLYISPNITENMSAGSEAVKEVAYNGMMIFVLTFLLVLGVVGLQAFFLIWKPYQEKIEEMERAAEESKEAEIIRREFVANVSHELKTPLTSISGFIETLQAGAAEDPEIRSRFIDIIAIETSRLKRLIEDLLVLSDIENKRESEWTEFDIRSALERTIEVLEPIAEKKNIEIISEIDDGLVLKGSSDRFSQMMLNLIENAIKYSNVDGRIWIKAIKGHGRIFVSVKDEGIGIAPEHHQRLFERFYRVDKSRSKKVGGTGLGLSIVKHIAVLFGAYLNVESQIGKGTTFYVTFNTEEQ